MNKRTIINISPSIGVKMHITPNIGVLASVSDEAYLIKAFDTNRNEIGRAHV